MTVYSPNSIVRLGKVPWNNSYEHVRLWGTKAHTKTERKIAQENAMILLCPTTLMKTDYTYVRANNSIKVPFNIEDKRLYGYNYCMYKNANAGDKWFYAFITDAVYVNENTTELYLELDIMQTYMFDWNIWDNYLTEYAEEFYIEREHVSDDTLETNDSVYSSVAEPEMPTEYMVQRNYTDTDLTDPITVVQASTIPKYTVANNKIPPNQWSTTVSSAGALGGGTYTGIMSGANYFGFYYPLDKETYFKDYTVNVFIADMNLVGAVDGIVNIFQFPYILAPARKKVTTSASLPDDANWEFVHDTEPVSLRRNSVLIDRPSALDGYTPHNNKMFTYPYCFVRCDDNNGHFADYKFELWEKTNSRYTWKITAPLDPDATCSVVPLSYRGLAENWTEAFTFPITPKCSWSSSAYQTWSAQNALSNGLTALGSIAAFAIPTIKGASTAVKTFNRSLRSIKAGAHDDRVSSGMLTQVTKQRGLSPDIGITQYNLANQYNSNRLGNVAGQYADAASAYNKATKYPSGVAIAGLGGLAKLAGDYSRMSLVPNSVKGSTSGNSLFCFDKMTYNMRVLCVRGQIAKMIDSFFDMYGYEREIIKNLELDSRQNWNYIKTVGMNITGDIPADTLSAINAIFDDGVTFWHTNDMGNYALNNAIVS